MAKTKTKPKKKKRNSSGNRVLQDVNTKKQEGLETEKMAEFQDSVCEIIPQTKKILYTRNESAANRKERLNEERYLEAELIHSSLNFHIFTQNFFEKNETPDKEAFLSECYLLINDFVSSAYRQSHRVTRSREQQKRAFINDSLSEKIFYKDEEVNEKIKSSHRVNDEAINLLLDEDPTFKAFYETYKYNWEYENASIRSFFCYTLFWESYVTDLYVIRRALNNINPDEDKDKLLKFKMNDAAEKLRNVFIATSFASYETWQDVESKLFSCGASDKMHFTDAIAELIVKHDIMDDKIKTALGDTLFRWIQNEYLRNKKSVLSAGVGDEGADYKQYVRTHLLQNKDELATFIMNFYNNFKHKITSKACEKLVAKYYALNTESNNDLKQKISDYRKNENKYVKEIERLKKKSSKLEADYKELSEGFSVKIDSAVKNALKEQSNDVSLLRKSLKNSEDEVKKLTVKCEEMKKQIDSAKEASKNDNEESVESSSISLSSYMKIRNLRIVFVRSKFSENFAIFNELTKAFPNAKYVDTISNDYNVNSVDCVVMMVRCIKHYAYYKAKDSAKINDVPVVHCNYNNLDMVAKTILEAVKEG